MALTASFFHLRWGPTPARSYADALASAYSASARHGRRRSSYHCGAGDRHHPVRAGGRGRSTGRADYRRSRARARHGRRKPRRAATRPRSSWRWTTGFAQRFGDFESFPITIVKREDLSIVLSTPFMTYRRTLAEYLRMGDPLARIPWIPSAVVNDRSPAARRARHRARRCRARRQAGAAVGQPPETDERSPTATATPR